MCDVTLSDANAMIDFAFIKARELNTAPMAAIVLDNGGNIIAFKREDGASIMRFDIAYGKAWGAIGMLSSSRKVAEMAEARPTFVSSLATMSGGKIVPSPGGILIYDDKSNLLGSVGVSGDLPDLDEECAIFAVKSQKFVCHP